MVGLAVNGASLKEKETSQICLYHHLVHEIKLWPQDEKWTVS